ncbi:MAG: FMN-binding glutamate synthase family protein [Verrucomicrobiae bacterium]|nr:FMN-binding glutamate synthase family protein [Verrucomicrobiae bacterium]
MTLTQFLWVLGAIVALGTVVVVAVAIYDIVQRKHAILRNFPVIGHFRYLLEAIGPELRQYIVTDNDEERPFSRDQRRWVYASAKTQNNYFGFGTDNDLELEPNYLIVKHRAFPLDTPHKDEKGYDPKYSIPCAKILGGYRNRTHAFRPASVTYVSAMSFGSLGARAVESLNKGCQISDCLHNTGEGGVSPHHGHGAGLILQLGTAYFGSRDKDGRFSLDVLKETLAKFPTVKAIEIKLSQGAKPGLGGLLPKEKITAEIAAARGIPMDRDCASPAGHREFNDADSMLDFVEKIATETGLPVGIKSAVGELEFWDELARLCANTGRSVDFITIDGGEGGTGAAPLIFADHVALPFKLAFARVYQIFAEHSMQNNIVWNGSAKLGFPDTALFAFALGCDMIGIARESMLAIGCIQAQRCHTGHCPVGIATHHRWLARGLDPTLKSARLANYMFSLRKDLLQLSHACGVRHPSLVTTRDFEIIDGQLRGQTIQDLFGYPDGLGLPSDADQSAIRELMEQHTTAGPRKLAMVGEP